MNVGKFRTTTATRELYLLLKSAYSSIVEKSDTNLAPLLDYESESVYSGGIGMFRPQHSLKSLGIIITSDSI